MVRCAVCEKDFSEENLKRVISKKGVVYVCRSCYNDDMPFFEEPTPKQFEGIYARKSVYSRLSESAGVRSVEEHKKRISEFGKHNGLLREESMKKIVNKGFEDKAKQIPNESLIDNFHWVIMRARRAKKISQKQFAEQIQEPEVAISLAERGIIPEGSALFVRKLESSLGIRISKGDSSIFHKDLSDNNFMKKEFGDTDGELGLDDENSEDSKGHKKKKRRFWFFGKKKEKEEEENKEDSDEVLDNPFFKKAD